MCLINLNTYMDLIEKNSYSTIYSKEDFGVEVILAVIEELPP